MKISPALARVADRVDATFSAYGVRLTLGGEPTYVPIDPVGPEWSITALGPTKLRYGYALAEALMAETLGHAVSVFSPGKFYPGEVNPRWAINLVWNSEGSPLVAGLAKPAPSSQVALDHSTVLLFAQSLLDRLGLASGWIRAVDPLDETRPVLVLPLDHGADGFVTEDWQTESLELLRVEGHAGLRLPLASLPEGVNRRALTIEIRDSGLHVFLPPLLQKPWLALIGHIADALRETRLGAPVFAGYVPGDEAARWTKLGIASDPGVLEINLPPCANWREYAMWLDTLECACRSAGLRSFKQTSPEEQTGTGGGNHLLFGGPSLDANPLFTRPAWIVSMLRYWQQHPSLAYLFTGQYVGPSSQAPRPDECASSLYDLEMAYQFLASLPPGDHRQIISETLRHLHTDSSGNTHRSEASFDKFWSPGVEGGCRGLIEFRAVESLPHAAWMSAVALLWHALAAHLLASPCTASLTEHGEKLHDAFFLPSHLWADFEKVRRDLRRGGFALPEQIFRDIFAWRFPVLLQHTDDDATLTIRRALEGWPLLCETPLEGGSTSRFVDTSMERLEFIVNPAFAATNEVRVGGRLLTFRRFPGGVLGAGLRYRRTALYPSLHPGIPPHLPLHVAITHGKKTTHYELGHARRHFVSAKAKSASASRREPCKNLHRRLLTFDLRLE
ncbi:MAG: transglutaminase family protein [Chthoniobacter sp.]|nr:transglutaminase family protein [Chthoniobacter sp.]